MSSQFSLATDDYGFDQHINILGQALVAAIKVLNVMAQNGVGQYSINGTRFKDEEIKDFINEARSYLGKNPTISLSVPQNYTDEQNEIELKKFLDVTHASYR